MAARIVNLADPDEDETLYPTVEDAEQALAAMVERFKSQGYRIDEQRLPNEDYAQYAVYDHGDNWIGTYTIIL
jgi:Asp-tRNA(Asn)/Glu-tRNA(Gln) amidotransferase A subunit family amidase